MPTNIAPYAFLFECALVALAAIVGFFVGVSPVARMSFRAADWPQSLLAICWGLAACVPPLAALAVSMRVELRSVRGLRALMRRRIMPLFSKSSVWELAAVSLAAGVGEELLFRGLIQDGLAQNIGGSAAIPAGLIGASILFGLGHSATPAYGLMAFVMSLYLGALYEITDSLLAPIVAHAAYDFVALLVLQRRGRTPCS